MTIPLDYTLPAAFRAAPAAAEPEPLWRVDLGGQAARDRDRRDDAGRADADPFRAGDDHPPPAAVARWRLGFLLVTLLVLGWG